jgi:copper(I)-binding protein
VRNTVTTDDVLTAVETPVAHMAELHATEMKDGVVSMVPVETLEIPAGGEAALKPGGTHVMLMMLTGPLKEGESVPLTLVFEHAGRIDLTVPVYGVGSRGPNE